MAIASFAFAPLLAPGLPPPAAKWTGRAKYNFTGGNNDADEVPVDGLVAAATTVLQREGGTLASYGLESGPLGYRPLREFLADKLKRTAGIACTADEILITSGSLQGLDLVNGVLLAPGDTVLIEQESYQGSLTRLVRLGVNAVGSPPGRMVRGEYCTRPSTEPVAGLTRALRAKLDTLMDALAEHFGTTAEFDEPKGGIFLWVKLPDAVDTPKLAQAALAAGVAINPGPDWSVNKPYGKSRLRLCFASPSVQAIREGVGVLAEVCRREFGVPERIANVERRARA